MKTTINLSILTLIEVIEKKKDTFFAIFQL